MMLAIRYVARGLFSVRSIEELEGGSFTTKDTTDTKEETLIFFVSFVSLW